METSTIARPYAKAAFAFAVENDQLAHWSHMLETLAVISVDEQVKLFLENPVNSREQRASILCKIADSSIDQNGKNLVETMSVQNRLGLLPEVKIQFEQLKADKENAREVRVLSAYPLSDAELEKLTAELSKKFSANVNVNVEIAKELIGGVLIESDGVVIDNSIRGKLKKLAESLSI